MVHCVTLRMAAMVTATHRPPTGATAVTRLCVLFVLAAVLIPQSGSGQWRNRYPHVDGYGHHVYLEGYELPILTNGPIDPAPSPDGRRIAFAARGWIWVMDLETRTARRLTNGRDVDSRPAWHPSGNRIAFVRDNDHDTRIVVVSAATGDRLRTVDSPAIDLDPAWSADGNTLYYTSGEAGTLDVWALDLGTGNATAVTTEPGIEMRPQPVPGADAVMILAKRGGDRVELRHPDERAPTVLVSGSIASMARPAVAPDGADFALNWPTQNGWELRVHSISRPGPSVLLTGGGLPLTPAWSADGEWVYFSEADAREVMGLKRVRKAGGPVEDVDVAAWLWETETARVRIRTNMPARLTVVDAAGHPAIPDEGIAHSEGAGGRIFFYTPGQIEVTVPAGEVTVSAVRGLATPERSVTVAAGAGAAGGAGAGAGAVTEVELELDPVWDARAAGWTSGDHHFHLNYGGQYDLDPADMVPMMKGEELDVASPLLANLHNRYEDQDLWGWEKSDASPLIRFGQEIRSHFLGHMGLIEIPELHWPWVWGPGYEVYGTDDRTNAEVLAFAHDHGGLGYYVHPVGSPDPFVPEARAGVPVELVADAVMGDVGRPRGDVSVEQLRGDRRAVAPLPEHRADGGAVRRHRRHAEPPPNHAGGRDARIRTYRRSPQLARICGGVERRQILRHQRPFLDFRAGGARPGEVVEAGSGAGGEPGTVQWTLDLATATSVDTVEILVNGQVVQSRSGIASPGQRSYSGEVTLPEGGWIAARASGGETRWPSVDTSPFAHTAPVWIGERGSTDPVARRTAAAELLDVLIASRARLRIFGPRVTRDHVALREGWGCGVAIPAIIAWGGPVRASCRS